MFLDCMPGVHSKSYFCHKGQNKVGVSQKDKIQLVKKNPSMQLLHPADKS